MVDLAAGTGKLTRLLVDRGFRVIAVEPIREMREVLARHTDAEVVEGTAESIPLPDATARAVTVAQAFHWFEPDRALPEIARVLAPDGLLAIVANVRDKENPNPLQTALTELLAPHKGTYPNPDWPDGLPASGLFDVEPLTFPHEQVVDEETFVERVASISWVGALPEDDRERVLADARALVAGRKEPIKLPYVTQVFLCRRRR